MRKIKLTNKFVHQYKSNIAILKVKALAQPTCINIISCKKSVFKVKVNNFQWDELSFEQNEKLIFKKM